MKFFKEEIILNNFKISLFKCKEGNIYVYIYNKQHYCIVKIVKVIKVILKNQQSLLLLNNNKIKLEKTTKTLYLFLKQFFICNFAKIKFAGKGYKIKKNTKNSLLLLFNRSHMTSIWWKNLFIKKYKKYKLYIKYTKKNINIIQLLLKIRYVNIFTKKGLRKSRQILLKKKGKK